MCEPLFHLKGLSGAIKILHSKYPRFSLLIITSAPKADYEAINKLSVEVPTVGLQFSVHESTDEARDKLIPFKAKLTLNEIALAGEAWFLETGRQPFFNYCAHEGNTSQEDADKLFELLSPKVWQASISVFCESDESVAAADISQRQLASDCL